MFGKGQEFLNDCDIRFWVEVRAVSHCGSGIRDAAVVQGIGRVGIRR